MRQTPNLSLKLPDLTDYVNIEDINENMETIDEAITKATELSDGAWEKIAEQTITSSVGQIDFINIPIDFKKIKIIFEATTTNTIAGSILLRFNDDTNANYRWQRLESESTNTTSRSTVSADAITLAYTTPPKNAAPSLGIIEISRNLPTQAKRVLANWYADKKTNPTATDMFLCELGGLWNNKTTEINKISLVSIDTVNSKFDVGSNFVLWGAK